MRHQSLSLFVPIVVACASTPAQHERVLATTDAGVVRQYENNSTRTAVVHAAPDRMLAALKAAYAGLGIETKLWDPSNGQVGNREFVRTRRMAGAAMSQYVSCGTTLTGEAADSYRITISLVSQVSPVADSSRIDTQLVARADDMASNKGTITCQTLGTLEGKLYDIALKDLGM
ncbi:MAG: hypothetical protein ACRENK_07385 [Gemmatimonadaceae bacterium]